MTRRSRTLLVAAILLLALALGLRWLSRPQQVAGILLNRTGAALGLVITAEGTTQYTLRGTPMLVLRGVSARQPDSQVPLLRARRIYVSLPWSTLRAMGDDLTVRRVELDAPRIDLVALQRWLDSRPPSEARLPTITDGVRVRDGELVADGWRVAGIGLDVPRLRADELVRGHLRGRYLAAPLTVPFDLAIAITRPQILVRAGGGGFGANGRVTLQHADGWRMPATIALSGPLLRGDNGWRLQPAHLGADTAYIADKTRVPFVLGVHGPMSLRGGLQLSAAGLFVRGRGDADTDLVPTVRARGSLALDRQLTLDLQGEIARWPQAWPALPPPIGQSDSPLPFHLQYRGNTALEAPLALQLHRDDTRFDGRLRLPQMLAWIEHASTDSPLPPLAGTLSTPRVEVSGAVLEGVEVEFVDDEVATP
jgi:hypothetical protein